MEIIFVLGILIIGGIILGIITMKKLKKGPQIQLIQGKLNDRNSKDDINDVLNYLKIVNKN